MRLARNRDSQLIFLLFTTEDFRAGLQFRRFVIRSKVRADTRRTYSLVTLVNSTQNQAQDRPAPKVLTFRRDGDALFRRMKCRFENSLLSISLFRRKRTTSRKVRNSGSHEQTPRQGIHANNNYLFRSYFGHRVSGKITTVSANPRRENFRNGR